MRFFSLIAIGLLAVHFAPGQEPLKIGGSSTVSQATTAAAPVLQEKLGIELKMMTDAGPTVAFAALGEDQLSVALSTRPISAEERAGYPQKQFREFVMGWQVLVPIVAADVWNAGVRSISKEQFLKIYESSLRRWDKLGGPGEDIKFYRPSQGRGVWELFALWLYGDLRRAPLGQQFEEVVTDEDARNAVEFNLGSISIVPIRWADGKRVFALAIQEGESVIQPTIENVRDGRWPLSRPLLLVTGDKPTGDANKFIQFMLGPDGQAALKKVDFVPAAEAGAAK